MLKPSIHKHTLASFASYKQAFAAIDQLDAAFRKTHKRAPKATISYRGGGGLDERMTHEIVAYYDLEDRAEVEYYITVIDQLMESGV